MAQVSAGVGEQLAAAPDNSRWEPERDVSVAFALRTARGWKQVHGSGRPRFTLAGVDEMQLEKFLRADAYSLATAFLRGEFDIEGDLIAAVRFQLARRRRGLRDLAFAALARFAPSRLETWFQSRSRAARNIRFHYDRSNAFYRQFLDSRMVYSCGYFKDPGWPIEQAQEAKLDHICRKLELGPDERFLDIGSGWGALVIHAAERYGARATGCTLSRRQSEFAAEEVRRRGLEDRVRIVETDYRDLRGRFAKVASVGMFEHVGRHRLRGYFERVCGLLEDDGLFLNHGIMRPQRVSDGPETLFLQRRVFPGGELAHLSDVIREAENAGFEVLDVENLRPHYALTCRAWVERLRRNAAACVEAAGEETYRTWLLFLAASAASFEQGATDVYQLLLAKRHPPGPRRLTRDYMYR